MHHRFNLHPSNIVYHKTPQKSSKKIRGSLPGNKTTALQQHHNSTADHTNGANTKRGQSGDKAETRPGRAREPARTHPRAGQDAPESRPGRAREPARTHPRAGQDAPESRRRPLAPLAITLPRQRQPGARVTRDPGPGSGATVAAIFARRRQGLVTSAARPSRTHPTAAPGAGHFSGASVQDAPDGGGASVTTLSPQVCRGL